MPQGGARGKNLGHLTNDLRFFFLPFFSCLNSI